MCKRFHLGTLLAAIVLLALGACFQAQAEEKANPVGTWKWVVPGTNGNSDRTNTLVLKLEGDKLAGTLSTRMSGQPVEFKLEDGKFTADQIVFIVTREFGGNNIPLKYSGKITGDVMKGKTEWERSGSQQSREWEAKRQQPEKK